MGSITQLASDQPEVQTGSLTEDVGLDQIDFSGGKSSVLGPQATEVT